MPTVEMISRQETPNAAIIEEETIRSLSTTNSAISVTRRHPIILTKLVYP